MLRVKRAMAGDLDQHGAVVARYIGGDNRLGPLNGVRVLDFSQFMAGPLAAQRLGDYGADVIKVEMPARGEGSRHASASKFTIAGERASFVTFNRNKRSITLDLKKPEGIEICLGLLKQTDVLVENFRPGVMSRLGLGYEVVSQLNPKIIYASVTGYGTTGPYRDFPGQDLLVQCLSGLVYLNGRAADPPTPVGTPIIDAATGQQLALGIVAALFNRERTGEGQQVEVSLLDTAIDLQAQELTTYLNCNVEPQRSAAGIAHAHFIAPYGIYATKDRFLALAHTPLSKLGAFLGLNQLTEWEQQGEAFERRDEIYGLVASVLKSRTTTEWLDQMRPRDFWCGPVQTYSELANSIQVKLSKMVVEVSYKGSTPTRLLGIPIKFSKTPGSIRRVPPDLGEHTREVLAEFGCSDKQIADLKINKVV